LTIAPKTFARVSPAPDQNERRSTTMRLRRATLDQHRRDSLPAGPDRNRANESMIRRSQLLQAAALQRTCPAMQQ
jgi:hypothetical protein